MNRTVRVRIRVPLGPCEFAAKEAKKKFTRIDAFEGIYSPLGLEMAFRKRL